ncbi:MAG: cytochrome c3 family protein [candidate division Zixibacteria bacterium]|nr:cytochrome c3 family protein [candidate division Zixibacteria bacterium]
MRKYKIVFLLTLISLFIAISAQAKEIKCLSCHGAKDLVKTDEYGKKVSLYADPSIIKGSIHEDLTCIDCHSEVKDEAHMVKPGMVQCGRCHKATLLKYRESFHGRKYLEGIKDAPWCQDCHGSHNIRGEDDPKSLTYRLNIPKMCGNCHADTSMAKKYNIPVENPYKLYHESIHGKAIEEKGLINSAVCNDCHESHSLKEATDTSSLIYRYNVPSTCGKCHYGDYQVFKESIHGQAVLARNPEAPVCTDCHSEHSIQPPWVKTSTVYPANISRTTCPWCHSAEVVTDRYGLVSRRVTKYLDSYHGVDSRAGRNEVANCASCHGYHDIRPSTDPKSSINLANLPKTCGNCHPNAGENFAKGKIHINISPKRDMGVYTVRRIYTILIILIIGGMVLHNALIIFKRVREKYKEAKEGTVIRFNRGEIIQHLLLLITFATLVISGFALRFPDAWWAKWMLRSEAGAHFRSDVHRVAAVIFILVSLYHIYYLISTKRGRAQLRALFPTPNDLSLLIQNINYQLGLVKERPEFDRYAYMEKAEYWALIWGTIVMVITGFPMWFENFFLKYMPTWLLNVFKAIHFYEAILATTAILIWHMFFMIFEPESYPVNFGMMFGRITEKELEEKHPAEYERLKAKDKSNFSKEE